ncbi:MAG TPA: hypothetical protein VKE53_01715 [Pseudolabrys sp.]|nr:hypothetical protein [Pseudolabrys sp.]
MDTRRIPERRTQGAAWVRLLAARFLTISGILGIVLLVLGFWILPLGLALLAIDVPFLHGPFARILAVIN